MTEKEDFAFVEYKESLEMYRVELSIWMQIMTALAIANVTVLGFAVSNQKAGLFLVGSSIPILVLLSFIAFRRYLVSIAYRPIMLEAKYGDGSKSFVSTMIASFYSQQFVRELRKLDGLDDNVERIHQLKQLKGYVKKRVVIFFLGISVVQIVLVPMLMLVFHWPFA